MKKIIMLLFAIVTMTSAMAQSDYTYLDAVKALTETGSLETLGQKGYEMKKEAKGASHELFFIKGKMYLGEDYEWHGKDNASSLVRVTYVDNALKGIDIIYTSLQSIEESFDELRFSKPTALGEDTEGTDKVFKFQTDQLNVSVDVPENHETTTFHLEKK